MLTETAPDPRDGAYRRARRWVDAIDGVLVAIAALMLFALMMVVVADVSLRYLFNAPLHWSYEVISSYLMPGLFFLAVSHTLKAHSHVAVDIVHNYVQTRTRYAFETIGSLLAFPVFALCTWVAASNTIGEFQSGATSSSGLALASWTVSIFFPLGFGLLTLRLLINAFGYAASLAGGRTVLALPPISGTEEGAQ